MGCVPSSERRSSASPHAHHPTAQPIVPESNREMFEQRRRSRADSLRASQQKQQQKTIEAEKKKTTKRRTRILSSINNKINNKGTVSPHYSRLPPNAKKCKVKSVYDGDTLTLYNKKRVRFLGIDTPELKNPTQAFSEQARDYTVERCLGQQIWISFEDNKNGGAPQEDRFGRLLAWVWISNDDGTFECVNEGLLKEGLASVYIPSKSNNLHNKDKLIALQNEARQYQRGMWKRFRDYQVLQTPYGTAFHHKNGNCEHLKRSKKVETTMASAALDKGRHACRTCLAEAEEDTTETTRSSHVSVYQY